MKSNKQIPLGQRLQKQLVKRIRATVPSAVLDRVPALMQADVPDEHVSIRDTAYPVQVTQILKETDQAVTVRFKPIEGYRLHYRAGQYVRVAVQMGRSIFRRCYSLTSSPDEPDMAITVKKVFHGRVSKFLVRRLNVGDVFFVEDPMGEFVLPAENAYEKRYVMIAAGSGIAPVFALIKDIVAKNPEADILLLYSNRASDDVLYKKSLDHMAKFYRGFKVQYFYTRETSRRPKRQLTPALVLEQLADPTDTYIYICAPNSLVKGLMVSFHGAGIDEKQVKVELFGTTPAVEDNTELKPRVVSFYRTGMFGGMRHVRQRKVETVLETARKNNIRIASQCTMGTCKSCKVKVKKGSVIMDEPNSLSLQEVEDGYVLACVAYPCESLIVKLPSNR